MPSTGRLVLHDVGAGGELLMERSALRSEVTLSGPGGLRELAWLDGTEAVGFTGAGSVVLQERGDAGGPDFGVYLRTPDGAAPVRLGSGRVGGATPDDAAVMVVPVREPEQLELLPIGAGDKRVLRFPPIAQYEWGRLLPDGRSVLFVGGVPDHNYQVWIAEGGAPPRALTPDGVVARPQLVSTTARRFVTTCPPGQACVYDFDGSSARPVPGPQDWFALALEPDGRGLLVRRSAARFPVVVERVDLATGALTPWHELRPSDVVGVGGLRQLVLAADGVAYAFSYERRLSELYVVPPLR
jgi:hypothetical protein